MTKLLRILGRVLFVAVLIFGAYNKIVHPEQSKSNFVAGYNKIHSCASSYGVTFLPSESEVQSVI